jgi:adenylate cyclase
MFFANSGRRQETMAANPMQRRLTTILAADVAGYSRLAGADEEGTVSRLRALRQELIDPVIAAHGGRTIKLMGDGRLTEFASVVDAVRCALEVQRGMTARNANVAPDRRIEFRVGIHLVDVIVESDGDLMGDGVNIAARLEGIAEPGGICLSEDAWRQVDGKVPAAFVDLGEQALKNIAKPVRAYRVELPRGANEAADAPRPALALPDRPSIAVLPFQNMSGDAEQEYFADGLAEDIITSLSKIRRLLVIARNSTFTYKNKAVDVRQVARELSVRYVLEGSVRRSGDRFRITAQLIEAATGNHLWAERYDRPVRDVFDIQDEITREIVLALSVELSAGEQALVFSRSTRSLDAWLAAMRGMDDWVKGSPQGNRAARAHFERAVAIDPDYTIAWAFIGWTYYADVRFGFSADLHDPLAKAAAVAEKAVAMSRPDAHAHGGRAGIWAIQGRFEDAVREGEIAVAGAPNDAWLKCVFARVLILAGYASRGVEAIRETMQLDPFHPSFYFGILANGLEELGRNDEAIAILNEAVRREPDYFAGQLRLASLQGLADRNDAASAALKAVLRINPRFTMAMAEAFYASAKADSTVRFKLGLRKAGLPE